MKGGWSDNPPKEWDFIKLRYAAKLDKKNKFRITVLTIEPTDEVDPKSRKDIKGYLWKMF